jgi:Signal transduction histidine kinase, nitrogen specific
MAAGIAHEIRNPMTTVRGFLQILGKKERYSSDMEFLNLMVEELDRANSIITEFLSLAKNKAVEFKTKNLNEIVKVLYPLITADAALNDKYLKLELSEIPNLLLDEKEIRQLILNLTRNGLEAMTRGCCLVIKTYVDNNEVVLAVIDQGRGIDLQLIDKISTPFFTTKDNGVGLGLATCYSIANRHNAKINFDTGADGTIFYVRFKVTKVSSEGIRSVTY